MKLRTRLLVAQLVPLAPLLVTAAVAVAGLWTLTLAVEEVRVVELGRIEASRDAIEAFREEVVAWQRFEESGEVVYRYEAEWRSVVVKERLAALGDPTMNEAFADWQADPSMDLARDLVRRMQRDNAELRAQTDAELNRVSRLGRSAGAGVIFVTGVVLVAGALATIQVGRDISRTLRELERGTTALAAGDLSHRIGLERDDELGQVARAFDHMAARIEVLDRMKVDFIANVSHDLKTPLTSMKEAVDLLEEGVAGPLTPDQVRLVGILKDDVRRLESLVRNVLDLSRLGHESLAAGDVRASVEAVTREFGLLASRRGIRFELELETELPPVVINRGMLEQVLMNLLSNALKFGPRDSWIFVRAHRDSGGVQIEVEDQGPGVPPAWRERIFERFVQVPGDSERLGGTGLGLTICREIVGAHGGWIRAEGEAGARMVLWLPAG